MSVDMAAYAEALKSYPGMRTDQHHVGSPECRERDHCHVHEVDEPHPDDLGTGEAYRICFECGHVYLTEHDLEAAYAREARRAWQAQEKIDPGADNGIPQTLPADEIGFCQECVHDF
jgi:hypothetical protein